MEDFFFWFGRHLDGFVPIPIFTFDEGAMIQTPSNGSSLKPDNFAKITK